jgi:hypothetical protein
MALPDDPAIQRTLTFQRLQNVLQKVAKDKHPHLIAIYSFLSDDQKTLAGQLKDADIASFLERTGAPAVFANTPCLEPC